MSSITPFFGRTRLWHDWWPCLAFLVLCVVLGLVSWLSWPQVMVHTAGWQRALNQSLSGLVRDVAMNPSSAGGMLVSVSFLYGVLHALGPGHGKMVIVTWLATHPARIRSSLLLALLSSLLQGGMAILLVVVTLKLLSLPARQRHLSQYWLECGSYLLMGSVGLLFAWRAISRLRQLRQNRCVLRPPEPEGDKRTLPHCHCGHRHVPDPASITVSDGWRSRVMIIVSMGIRPCSGAVLILLFSEVVGVLEWGMLAVMAMAAGTAMTISALALLVQRVRHLAIRLTGQRTPALWHRVAEATLMLAGGCLLATAALLLWSSLPPLEGGGRPF